jgi:hypothetical protein
VLLREPDEDAAIERRRTLVGKAYGEFRSKWGIATPEHYPGAVMASMLGQARANVNRVALKCEMPEAILDDLEFY